MVHPRNRRRAEDRIGQLVIAGWMGVVGRWLPFVIGAMRMVNMRVSSRMIDLDVVVILTQKVERSVDVVDREESRE